MLQNGFFHMNAFALFEDEVHFYKNPFQISKIMKFPNNFIHALYISL